MQIFPRALNKLPQVAGAAGVLGLPAVVFFVWYYFSPWYTQVGYQPTQPVPYSHRKHAGELGMDCRYCHANVERAPYAMVPPTETCMNCHQLIRTDSAKLERVRESWATGAVIPWIRIHKLPDYVYFDHSVHVTAGVGCAECHGRIDQMEVVRQQKPLSMGWCLECHRDVKQNQYASTRIRPVDQITNMEWQHDANNEAKPIPGRETLNPPEFCSGCHR
jgi:hypothetical protein